MDFFEVEVSGLKAANMNTGNLLSYSLYVRVFVGDTNVGCTQTLVRTENPAWKDKLTFTIPQISNTFVMFKVFDAVIIGEDTLLGFVEVPIRLDNSVSPEISDLSTLRDGEGILEYKIKCTQLPLVSLTPASYGANRVIDRYSQLGLYRSLLPRNIRSIFLREFENCACSRATSNLFAIDAARDFEELFTLRGHSLSLDADPVENTAPVDMDVGDTSPLVIDGRVQGSIVAVVLPPPELLKMRSGEAHCDTPEEASQSTVSVIRLRPCYGKVAEKMVCVDSNRGPLNVSWSDVICTDRLSADGIVVDIVTTCLHPTEKKPTAADHAASGQDAPLPSEVDTDSGKLQCRAYFTYQELLESGRGSTGVDGEMIIDNKLKLQSCPRREFEVSLSGGSTASGADTWGLLSVTVCNSSEEMVQKMTEKFSANTTKPTQQQPFAWRDDPLFQVRSSAAANCRLESTPPRANNPPPSRPALLSQTLASEVVPLCDEGNASGGDGEANPAPSLTPRASPSSPPPQARHTEDPTRRTGPPPLPPLPPDSPKCSSSLCDEPAPSPSRPEPPPLPPLPAPDHEGEASAPAITTRRPSFKPTPPPEISSESTPRRPSFTPAPTPGGGQSVEATDSLPPAPLQPPHFPATDGETDIHSKHHKGPPLLPPLPPRSPGLESATADISDPESSWLDDYDRNAALFSKVALNASPSSEQQKPAGWSARKTEEELRMFWASSSEDSSSESDDLFAHWTEVLHDDVMDSSSDCSTGKSVRVRQMVAAEGASGACLSEYLVIDLKRNAGNLLVGFQKKEAVEGPSTRESEVRASIAAPSVVNEQLRAIASRSRYIRVAVPLPARMLSAQCLSADSEDPLALKVVLPPPPGSSTVDNCVLTVCCRAAASEAADTKTALSSSYGVHLRWTVANPSSIGFNVDNTYHLSLPQNQSILRTSPIGVNAYSMVYRCRELSNEQRPYDTDSAEQSSTELVVDMSPAGVCVHERDSFASRRVRLPCSPRKIGAISHSTSLTCDGCDKVQEEMSPVPTTLPARVYEKKKVSNTDAAKITVDDDDDDDDDDEDPLEKDGLTECGVAVDLTSFLRSDESPFGFAISIDVYENQFMLVPRTGAKQRGVTLRGQRWMPLGARSSLSSRGSVSVGPFSFTPKDSPVYHTFSDISGEKEFPTYASLVPAADAEGLLAKTHSISDDVIEMDDFEVSGDWVLVKAFGSKGMGYETRIDVQQQQQPEDDYDDLGDDDGECWWYAATLENLLTNTACYQSYYPGCLYRRRCWRKYLRHKVSSLLRFEDLHRKMKPCQLQGAESTPIGDVSLRCENKEVVDINPPNSPHTTESGSWEWNWADVTDCLVLSRSSVALTVKTGIPDEYGVFSTRSFIIGPCCAKRIVDIIALRRGLADTRDMIERTVIPAIRSGRNLFHCNRIDSCGYISIVGDVRKDVLSQQAILKTMSKLREVIQDATVAMIPELHKKYRSGECIDRCNLVECDLVSFSPGGVIGVSQPASRGQPVPLTLSFPDVTDCPRETPDVEIIFLLLERLVGYYRLISGYTKQGSAISKSPLRTPTLLATTLSGPSYMPNSNFLKDRAPSINAQDLTRNYHTMWKLDAEDEQMDEIVKDLTFFRPEYTVKDTLVYITKLMSTAVDGILCSQKAAVSTGDVEMATHRYLQTLSEYANNCVCKIVSVIRAIIAWNSMEDVSSKAGPWADGFLPLTTFIMRNNPRLMLTLLAVTTTAPFGVKKVPCFSRYTGIRTLIHWELQPRARSLFSWVKSLRKGGLKYILEVLHYVMCVLLCPISK